MIFRAATEADLSLLQKWNEQPHLIASGLADDWEWDIELNRNPSWREQLIAEENSEPIGFVQIIDPELEESHYWGDIGPNFKAIDIWIGEEENTGKGFGTTIMKMAIERCFSDIDTKAILVDPLPSNRRARNFYEKLGFKHIEDRKLNGDLCSIYRLDRSNV